MLAKQSVSPSDEDMGEEDVKKAESAFLQRAYRMVSFALQRGNAHVSSFGTCHET